MSKIIKENLKEKKHIVAYLDILGAKNRIKNGDSELLNQLDHIYNVAILDTKKINEANNNENLPDIRQQIFSDNIIFAQELKEDYTVYQVFNFVLFISTYLHQALHAGLLIRGGITIGGLHIDSNFVSGQALIRAYKLESEIAVFPRVIVDFDVFGVLSLLDDNIHKNFSLIVGDDLLYYIDACRMIYVPGKCRVNFDQIRESVLRVCKYQKDLKILQKHLWLINQFNDYCTINNHSEKIIGVFKEYADVEKIVRA